VEEALTAGASGQATGASNSSGAQGVSTPQMQRLQAEEPPVSPLVERGYILNEATGRTILIGKPTYNKLVLEGYQVDKQKGTMTPPGGKSSSGGAVSPRKNSSGRVRKGSSASSPIARTSVLSTASGLPLPD